MYEKKISKPLRKLSFSILSCEHASIDELLNELSQVKHKVEIKSI